MPCLECILLSFAWNCFTNTCDYLLKGLLLTLFDKYLWLSSEGVALRRSVERVCARRSLLFTSSVAPVSLWIMFHFVCLSVCLFVYLCSFINLRRIIQFAFVCLFVCFFWSLLEIARSGQFPALRPVITYCTPISTMLVTKTNDPL